MDRLSGGTLLRRIRSSHFARRALILASIVAIALVSAVVALPYTSRIVVVNDRTAADVVLVVAVKPYRDDIYYFRALGLLGQHYGRHLLFPADASGDAGRTEADEAQTFIATTAGAQRGNASVCPVQDDEYQAVRSCLEALHARTVLMVVPAPESRRVLMLYREHLPNYVWHVAAVTDPSKFGTRWWSNREWAKGYVEGLQRLIYTAVRQ